MLTYLSVRFNSCLLLLRPRQRLRSIVMSMSVCLSARISPESHARSLPNFLCMLPMSVARSSSIMFTIGRIAYRREGVFFPIENALLAGKGGESAQRGRSMLSTIALLVFGVVHVYLDFSFVTVLYVYASMSDVILSI